MTGSAERHPGVILPLPLAYSMLRQASSLFFIWLWEKYIILRKSDWSRTMEYAYIACAMLNTYRACKFVRMDTLSASGTYINVQLPLYIDQTYILCIDRKRGFPLSLRVFIGTGPKVIRKREIIQYKDTRYGAR